MFKQIQGEDAAGVETWDPDSEDEVTETGTAASEIPYTQSRLIRWYTVVLFTFQFLFSLSDTALHYVLKFFSTFIYLLLQIHYTALDCLPLLVICPKHWSQLGKLQKLGMTFTSCMPHAQSAINCTSQINVLYRAEMALKSQNCVHMWNFLTILGHPFVHHVKQP